LEQKQGKTAIGIDRLLKKEECVFRMGDNDCRRTQDLIVEKRRNELLEHNMNVFGNIAIGIHGRELPKYNQTMDKWWLNKSGYNSEPNENSLLRFKQSTKYWAKPDNIYLCDAVAQAPGPDDFKRVYITKPLKNDVAADPNKLKMTKKKETLILGKAERPHHDYRWSSVENQFVKRSNKYTNEVDKARAERTDYEPLYSSFGPKGTFMPPPTAADMLNLQKGHLNKTSISQTVTNKSRGFRTSTAVPAEESLMATGQNSTNLFKRVGTVEGSPVKIYNKSFKNSTYKGIRVGAFKNL
jgi:hypothetical protein